MADRDLSALLYRPEAVTGEITQEQLNRELTRISAAFELITQGYRVRLNAAPVKPEEGMIVVADGVGWNPGSGAGAYERKAGVWVKL